MQRKNREIGLRVAAAQVLITSQKLKNKQEERTTFEILTFTIDPKNCQYPKSKIASSKLDKWLL
ncbi:hypothetical protein Osc7112_2148 [Oscillatoria nigro-viridis PCC 7112]|uniref:Uncharacterized protein n=2 Tax=Phormidium nigroviride TaxID=482564 RepID=K9VEV3_9CYAN|nr:hypothetical protein Osc7112_2148 [Oscillatoria nigro-viridis PCC 7112]